MNQPTSLEGMYHVSTPNQWTYELIQFACLVRTLATNSREADDASTFVASTDLTELTATASAIYHTLSAALDKAETDGATL